MAEPVRIVGHETSRENNEQLQAQVDSLGNLHVREGTYPGLAQTYEDTSFVAADSPQTHDFYSDTETDEGTGRWACDGWIICDGSGDIQVDYTRDGISYSDKFTMKSGEIVDLLRMDIKKIRVTHTGTNSAYRIFLI